MANKLILLLAVSLIAASTAVKAEDVSSIVRGGQSTANECCCFLIYVAFKIVHVVVNHMWLGART